MKTSILILFWLGLVSQLTLAQSSGRPKIILITLDGLRWQELFNGADPLLITNTDYVQDTADTKTLPENASGGAAEGPLSFWFG